MGVAWSRLANLPDRGRILLGTACLGVAGALGLLSRQWQQALKPQANAPHALEHEPVELKIDNECRIHDIYDFEEQRIGIPKPRKACKKETAESVAVKAIPKGDSSSKTIRRIWNEVDNLKALDHPNIIKLRETYQNGWSVFLVMDLADGGELSDRIIEHRCFSEQQAGHCMTQILRGVRYCHGVNICIRDLKPEAIMCMTRAPIGEVVLKLADLGLSTKVKPGTCMTTKAGTPYYVAPQVLGGKYDSSCDLWSCGVILYVMLCGYPPFYGETDADVLTKVRLGNYSFNADDWKDTLPATKDLIRMMLKMNPADRFTADQALRHKWLAGFADKVVFTTQKEVGEAGGVEIGLVSLGGSEAVRLSYDAEQWRYTSSESVQNDAASKLGLYPEQIQIFLPDGTLWEGLSSLV